MRGVLRGDRDMNTLSYDHDFHMKFASSIDFGWFMECWNWKGCVVTSKHSLHYKWGVLSIRGRTYKASRVSWMLNRGDIPSGANVLHNCDNSLCVNPGHLYLGTQKENIEDMDRKGRRVNKPRYGNNHHNSKLTDDQAAAIRLHIGPARIMADAFGISPEQVRNIRHGKQRKVIQHD